MNAAVCCIGEPQFSFIGRECYAVTWTAMSFRGAFLVAGHFHTMQHLSGFTVSDFKAEQLVDVDEAKRSEEHTSELQSPCNLVCRLLLEKKKYISSRS